MPDDRHVLNSVSVERVRSSAVGRTDLRVVHLVDAAGGAGRLWGKESVIAALMEAQRASDRVVPELVTFTPGLLDERMRAAGFRVHHLEERHRRLPVHALQPLSRILADGPPAVVHTHEYKANLLGRLARANGTPMRKLLATDHGWVDSTPQLEVYFALDRWTAALSDVVTVTDPAMISRFPSFGPLRPSLVTFVPNAVHDVAIPTSVERSAARDRFGFDARSLVVGSLGRLTKNKGILDILAAAKRTEEAGIVWAIAGAGALGETVERSNLPNVRYVGYQADSKMYLQALDAYVQASYFEGLSMSLLEAMRIGLPCIASRAGATEHAIRSESEGLLFNAGDIDSLVSAALALRANSALQRSLGRSARQRFEDGFAIERQHEAFLELYLA